MGDELQELGNKEDSSESKGEEQEVGPEGSHGEESEAPRNVTSPISLFGIPAKALAVPFGTFDDASVRDSVSSTMPR